MKGTYAVNVAGFKCMLCDVRHQFNAVFGFEPGSTHAKALTERLGVPVYSSQEELCAERAGTLDVVTAHFVLEHVTDLRGAFRTFRTLLKPGGRLYIAAPNIRSWEARLFEKRWHGLDAPRHLVFPGPDHFGTLANDYGFCTLQMSFAAFPNMLAASLATVLSGRCHPALLMGLIVPSWLVVLAAPQGMLVCELRKEL